MVTLEVEYHQGLWLHEVFLRITVDELVIGSTSRKSLLVNKLNTHSNMELLIPCGCNFAETYPVLTFTSGLP